MHISMGVHRDSLSRLSRGKRGSVLMIVITNLLGGDDVSSSSPRVLKIFIMHAVLAATKDRARSESHDAS